MKTSRVLMPCQANCQLVIYERPAGASGFKARAIMRADGRAVTEILSGTLSEKDKKRMLALAPKILAYQNERSRSDSFDHLKASSASASHADPAVLSLLRPLAEYETEIMIYGSVADAYLSAPAATRFDPERALSLFRQALDLHDLVRAKLFLEQDFPLFKKKTLSRHYRTCFGDVFFHIAQRLSQNRPAFEALRIAFRAEPNLDRSYLLRNLAAALQDPGEVVWHAAFQERQEQLGPLALAQLVVAHARLGDVKQAKERLGQLRSIGTQDAEAKADRVAHFLDGFAT